MKEDPLRPRVYAISAPKDAPRTITVGNHPSDLALYRDGNELLVINSNSQTANILESESLKVKETLKLPVREKDNAKVRRCRLRLKFQIC